MLKDDMTQQYGSPSKLHWELAERSAWWAALHKKLTQESSTASADTHHAPTKGDKAVQHQQGWPPCALHSSAISKT